MPYTNYTNEDLSYIAGLVDGEGYIGLIKHIEKRRRKTIKTRITCFYRPAVKIEMCDRDGIDFIDKFFEGNIWFIEHKAIQRGSWAWSAGSQSKAKRFLEAILPYLKIKKNQAELLIHFIKQREIKNTHRVKRGSTSYTKHEVQIYNKLRLLNKRGQ